MRRRARGFALFAVMVMTLGCTAIEPTDPSVLDPRGPLVVRARAALPVPPDEGGSWPLFVARAGVLGAGRQIARIGRAGRPLWSVTLPKGFALTSPRSAYVGSSHRTLIVLAGAATRPSAVLVLDLTTGRRLWDRRLPAPPAGGSVQLASGGGADNAVLVVARCGGGCDLTAVGEHDGRRLWSGRVPGADWISGGFEPVIGGRGMGVAGARTNVIYGMIWAGTEGSLWTVNIDDGRVGGRIPGPDEPAVNVIGTNYRTIVVTGPTDRSCRARAIAYDMETIPAGTVAWTQRFRWDDPRARPDEHGCRADPAQVLMWNYDLVLPDAEGPMVVDDYHGRVRGRRPVGEYQIAEGLVWDGHRYRDREYNDGRPLTVAPPADGRPWAIQVSAGAWVVRSGDGASLTQTTGGQPVWHQPGAVAALDIGSDRLAFLTRTEIVVIGPAKDPDATPTYR
jgi:hypothetical protein